VTPLPKRKLSRARQGKRRASIKLTLTKLVTCKKCHSKVMSHTVCKNCGTYNGRLLKKVKTKKAKK
jgi:large subunit ribosomal protein L32